MNRIESIGRLRRLNGFFAMAVSLFVCCYWPIDSSAQTEGLLVQTFPNETMGIHSRIFSVEMGNDGVIYAASMDSNEIVAFDGANWSKIEVPCPCWSIRVGQTGRVWLCLENEIGYLRRDELGEYKYQEFETNYVSDSDSFWDLSRTKTGVRFAGNRLILDIDETTEPPSSVATHAKANENFSSWTHNSIFVEDIKKAEFSVADGSSRIPFSGYSNNDLVDIIVHVTDDLHVYVCEGWKRLKTWHYGKWSTFSIEFDKLNQGEEFNWVVPMSNNRLGVGSKTGFYCLSETGRVLHHVNIRDFKNLGALYSWTEFTDDRIGLACENGIAILTPSSVRREWHLFDHPNVGVYDSNCENGVAHICTESGLYRIDLSQLISTNKFSPVPVIRESSTDVAAGEEGLLVTTASGVLREKGGSYEVLLDGPHMNVIRLDEEHFFAVDVSNVATIFKVVNGKAKKVQSYPNSSSQGDFFVQGNVFWQSEFNGNLTACEFPEGMENERLNVSYHSEIEFERAWVQGDINGDFVVLTDTGILVSKLATVPPSSGDKRASKKQESGDSESSNPKAPRNVVSLVKSKRFEQLAKTIRENRVMNLFACGKGMLALIGEGTLSVHELTNGVYQADPVAAWELPPSFCNGFWDEQNELMWQIERGKLVAIDINRMEIPELGVPVIAASTKNNSVEQPTTLSYRGNIKLSFGMPFGSSCVENIEYQHRLKGAGNQWSEWSKSSQVEYQGLSGGSYEFEARARNSFGHSSISTVGFKVQYPWFLSWGAIFGWISLLGFTIYGVSAWRSKQLKAANRRMEKLVEQRTEEIEQKKLEIQRNAALLDERERRSESDRLKSLDTLVSGIVHDFNNLLMVISANNEMIKLTDKDDVDRYTDSNAVVIQSAADLCRELADYSGSLPMELASISLNDVVRQSKGLIMNAAGNGVQIAYDLADEGGQTSVLADSRMLKRALVNLVVNAVECCNDKVVVATRCVNMTGEDLAMARYVGNPPVAGNYCCLSVTDDGDGILPEQMERLFDPFYSTKKLGRGLGLAIVMRATGRLNGVVFVNSDSGEGTRFELCFPATSWQSKQELGTTDYGDKDQAGLELLLVDDELQVLKTTEQILSAVGHRVTAFKDSLEALETVVEDDIGSKFDCAILDVSMPGMTGPEMAEILLKKYPDLPVLFVTGYFNSSLEIELSDRANISFLNKPFSINKINRALYEAVRESAQRRQGFQMRSESKTNDFR